ncbi:hypothetical protein ACFORO_28195 [Amycolatopsis halotolerans]|uniref:Uncharacterized protein n=1 Tax=Amycolatopsis halotolerans TaxID=330083 RepID=A0ABV7QPA5_9PSEU
MEHLSQPGGHAARDEGTTPLGAAPSSRSFQRPMAMPSYTSHATNRTPS